MEGRLKIYGETAEAILDDGNTTEIKIGDRFEVLVFSALLRFEWITVQLEKNEQGLFLKAPASRPVDIKKVSKIRIEV